MIKLEIVKSKRVSLKSSQHMAAWSFDYFRLAGRFPKRDSNDSLRVTSD